MRGVPRVALAFLAAFATLLLTHFPVLALPYYWDELGQFIPAALDIYHRLAWVPYSTVPNVHPPGLMAYLSLIWKAAGYSVVITRVAMLGLAACALVAQWRLARTLSGQAGAAWLATVLLFCCPLFFAQAELAQLDLPAALLTAIALTLFVEDRLAWCALVCCVAVMVKETAIVAPALFGCLLLWRKRSSSAFLFVLPLLPLGGWLFVLKSATGHWFGNAEFTDYNVFYPLNPVRFGLALARRSYYLGVGSGHAIGTLALVYRWRKSGFRDPWRIAFLFVALHVLAISLLGGAVLERYLLPALPVLYAAFGVSIWSLGPRLRRLTAFALTACLLIACLVNPLYPFPMENNLAWTTFVTLQQQAAAYVEAVIPDGTVATSFPMAGALRRPEFGFVHRAIHVLEINDFRADNLSGKVRGNATALVQYSVMWDPLGILKNPTWVALLTNYYGYVPQAKPEEIPGLTGMRSTFRLWRVRTVRGGLSTRRSARRPDLCAPSMTAECRWSIRIRG